MKHSLIVKRILILSSLLYLYQGPKWSRQRRALAIPHYDSRLDSFERRVRESKETTKFKPEFQSLVSGLGNRLFL